jgi:hypothetical protein
MPAILPQSVLGIGFHRTLEPNLKLKGGRLLGKSSGSAIASDTALGATSIFRQCALALLNTGIARSGWVDFSLEADF